MGDAEQDPLFDLCYSSILNYAHTLKHLGVLTWLKVESLGGWVLTGGGGACLWSHLPERCEEPHLVLLLSWTENCCHHPDGLKSLKPLLSHYFSQC